MFSYIWMKILEKKPSKYQRRFSFLTRAKIDKIRNELVDRLIEKDQRVLELGCGPGSFLILTAQKGAQVIGIDRSPDMLEVAKTIIKQKGFKEKIELRHMDILNLNDKFQENSFDYIFSFLTFSELEKEEVNLVLKECYKILKPEGELVLLDEILPGTLLVRFTYRLWRFPLLLLTYLFAGSITHPLINPEGIVSKAGFESVGLKKYPWSNLALIEAKKGALY